MSDSEFRPYCYRCNRPQIDCYCSYIRPLETRIRFVFLMHPKEARKTRVGTGLLTHLALSNSELITGVDFTDDPQVNGILDDPSLSPMVLYPGENSINISNTPLSLPDDRIVTVIILDGSWSLTRKMLRSSANLQGLPRISFTPREKSRFQHKSQPEAGFVSTIEAAYYILEEFVKNGWENCQGREGHLLKILDRLVGYQLNCARRLGGVRRVAKTTRP